jgi:hypothetical protein
VADQQDETTWFPSAEWSRGEGTTPFLERVRALAPERLGHLIEAGDTWETDYAGCLLMVDLPGIPDGGLRGTNNHIQVAWEDGVLGGYWGDVHLWDGFDERDEEALVVRGPTLTDAEAAEAAVAWLARQLSRPLDHQVWKEDRVVGQRWVLVDTGREVGRRGSRLARRGSPTVVTRLRPPGS